MLIWFSFHVVPQKINTNQTCPGLGWHQLFIILSNAQDGHPSVGDSVSQSQWEEGGLTQQSHTYFLWIIVQRTLPLAFYTIFNTLDPSGFRLGHYLGHTITWEERGISSKGFSSVYDLIFDSLSLVQVTDFEISPCFNGYIIHKSPFRYFNKSKPPLSAVRYFILVHVFTIQWPGLPHLARPERFYIQSWSLCLNRCQKVGMAGSVGNLPELNWAWWRENHR